MLHIFMCVDEAGFDLNKVKRPEWMCQTTTMSVANAQHGVIYHAASLGAAPQTGFFSCCTFYIYVCIYTCVLTLLYYIAPAAGFYVGAFFSLFLRHIVSRVILRFSISL